MGHNIDMVQMFGDFDVKCPHCGDTKKASETDLTDFDVDCTDYNPQPGVWVVDKTCYECEGEFKLTITIDHLKVETTPLRG